MALCPQCDHSVLVHTLLTENLAGYSCGKCLGTLVSLVAYRAWRESAAGRLALRGVPPAVADVDPPDSTGAKKCPKCRSLMSKYRVTADKANRLDYCPHCEEIWLDEGRMATGRGTGGRGRFCQGVHPGLAVRGACRRELAMEEQRLRELLGNDYDRVVQFADWLQTQPAKAEILAVLRR
jgi:Zn-finger nucleic acid-binding protein